MFGSTSKGVSAYNTISLETGVSSASPHALIVMLFDGALTAISSAITEMAANNIPSKGKSISKAIMIIDNGLRASLDKKVGGEIAISLDSLYEYMSNRLLIANLKNDVSLLNEVHGLLLELKSSWVEIGMTRAPEKILDPELSKKASASISNTAMQLKKAYS